MNIEFKQTVVKALLGQRDKFTGSDAAFATQWALSKSIYSRMKNGETERILTDAEWLRLARELGITAGQTRWKMAKTKVFEAIHNDVVFCQQHSKSLVFVDDCAIGKTYTAKYLAKTLTNCFYMDCSQSKGKVQFIRALAKTIGLDSKGKIYDVKQSIKDWLNYLPNPVVLLDEFGDVEYTAFLEFKELYNATEGRCGYYLMGAEGFRAKIRRGINNEKVGFREIFSRLGDKFMSIVPIDRNDRLKFYQQLITDVLSVNMADKTKLNELVKTCLASDANGEIGGLRRAETLLLANTGGQA
ncbi:MAG: ATP-binding protein [Bacteroidetes bacterium]|nr:MAG: ATP-binding protein [Bacteroidota bacterium]